MNRTALGQPAAVLYTNGFDNVVGAEWSSAQTSTTPSAGNRFLGRFGNDNIRLTLTNLLNHASVRVALDLFTIETWDGNDTSTGPDIWELRMVSGPSLLRTTFSVNNFKPQAYPGTYPGSSFPPYTGSTALNSLGFGQDATYHLVFWLPHNSNTLSLDFSGSGLQALNDESWGIDNISITSTDSFPFILTQPTSQTVVLGSNVTFQVTANGVPPLFYQWFFGTNTIVAGTNAALSLLQVQLNNAGTYFVTVSNALSSVTSSNATLVVLDSTDADGDGLPTYWEQQYGLNPANDLDAANHPSGDQLTYLQKYRFGLNPLTLDTDGDGLSDYDELFVYGTNPLLADTDGDGMPDGWEVANGLNPRANDANDDLDLDGLTNLQEYQNRALGYRPNQADSLGDGRSDSRTPDIDS